MATEASNVRTIAIVGQGGVGKTSLADAMIFVAGGNNRQGRVDDETSLFDTEPEEMHRRTTISSALHHCDWKKHDITIVDTPGQGNFVADTHSALRGVSGVVFVIDASSPLRAESSKVWGWAREENLPTLFVLNRLDRDEADVDRAVASLREELGAKPVLLELPLAVDGELSGTVDVLAGKAAKAAGDSGKSEAADVPADLADRVESMRSEITEDAAEGDDELLEKYLEEGELSADEVKQGLRAGVAAGTTHPVLCASASVTVGIDGILDAIVDLLPAPTELSVETGTDASGEAVEIARDPSAPFAGFVFKTIVDQHAGHLSVIRVVAGTLEADANVVNTRSEAKERLAHLLKLEGKKSKEVKSATVGEIVAVAKLKDTRSGDTLADPKSPLVVRPFEPAHPSISFAIEAKKRGEEDKATQGLHKLAEEDLALLVERDEESGEILLSGSGQLHVEVTCERLERKYGVGVNLKAPKVAYRETIRKNVEAHGRLKKQTGGHGQFADCRIRVEPLPRGGGFEFVDKIVGGAIPRGFIPAVEKGVVEAMKKGTIAGYPVVDVRVTLYDGQYHDVDSSEMSFKTAGSMAFKEAMQTAKPVLLEPYVNLEVTVPDECMGDVMGDLNSRRAKVEGMEQKGSNQAIKAKAPMSEVLRYAPDLTSMTSGRGSFELAFSHYEPTPEHLVKKITAEGSDEQGG